MTGHADDPTGRPGGSATGRAARTGKAGRSVPNGRLKICIVSSVGGHLRDMLQLMPVYGRYEHFYIINDRKQLRKDVMEKTYFIAHSERDWKFFLNLAEAYRILAKERPHVVLSTGAGPAVPVSLVAKYAFGCRVIFIEHFTAVYKPTLTGRIMYRLADRFLYQWRYLRRFFPKGTYGGWVY